LGDGGREVKGFRVSRIIDNDDFGVVEAGEGMGWEVSITRRKGAIKGSLLS
jgi:hypothetical protein